MKIFKKFLNRRTNDQRSTAPQALVLNGSYNLSTHQEPPSSIANDTFTACELSKETFTSTSGSKDSSNHSQSNQNSLTRVVRFASDTMDKKFDSLSLTGPKQTDGVGALKIKSSVIHSEYLVTDTVLGMGINGKVLECKSKATGKKYALKVLCLIYSYRIIDSFPLVAPAGIARQCESST